MLLIISSNILTYFDSGKYLCPFFKKNLCTILPVISKLR